MAASSFDPTDGHPIFADGDAPDVARNPTEVAEYAAKVGTRLIGTTAQRTAYPHGRDGLEWWDTSTDKRYVHDGSGWVAEKTVQSGTHTITSVGLGGDYAPVYWSGLQTVTFPKPFPAAPKVSLSGFGEFIGFSQVNDVTATSFRYRLARVGSTPAVGQSTMWIAQES